MTEREHRVNQQLRALDDAHRLGRITRGEYRRQRRRALETLCDPSTVVTARNTLSQPAATTMPRARATSGRSVDDSAASAHQALTSLLGMRPATRWMTVVAIVLGTLVIAALLYWWLGD